MIVKWQSGILRNLIINVSTICSCTGFMLGLALFSGRSSYLVSCLHFQKYSKILTFIKVSLAEVSYKPFHCIILPLWALLLQQQKAWKHEVFSKYKTTCSHNEFWIWYMSSSALLRKETCTYLRNKIKNV